jgi:hypothetical protein
MSLKERQAALNHRLKASQNKGASAGATLRCECSDLRCNATLELTREEMSRRRSCPGRFWIKPGHELANLERVVEGCDRFLVVQLEAAPF